MQIAILLFIFLLNAPIFLSRAQLFLSNDTQEFNNVSHVNPYFYKSDTISLSKNKLIIITEKCNTCLLRNRINLFINNQYYNTYSVYDSLEIYLPDSLNKDDIIKITIMPRKARQGWLEYYWTKIKIKFNFINNKKIKIKSEKKRRIRLLYKWDYTITPSDE